MLQFASQLVEAALTMAKQLWGTKTINTDSLLHPEPTCSLLRVPHREATPTSTITITVHKGAHERGNTRTHSDCFTWQNFRIFYVYNVLNSSSHRWLELVFRSAWWVGGPSVPNLTFSTLPQLFACFYACSTPSSRTDERLAVRRSSRRQTLMEPRSYKQAVHFDSSFSYCSVVGAAVFVFKVHLVHVSGVRWRFNWLHQTPVW